MRTAIYARKSNEESGKVDEFKSVSRQVEHARVYAVSKGWNVQEDHIYVDDGISGAEYLDRPGLTGLMASLNEFDVIVCSEISRIGRDMVRNAVVIDDILTSGVRIFYYLEDLEEKADTPEQRLMITMKSFASEMERANTAKRTSDALRSKFEKGYSVGGSCFGYRSVNVYEELPSGESVKSHVNLEINQEEAFVVKAIFQMYLDGMGFKAIAKTLNADPKYLGKNMKYLDGKRPVPPQNGSGSWGHTGIREMIIRKRYVGILEYGKTKRIRSGGSTKKRKKSDSVLEVHRDDLRIIDQNTWDAVQKRFEEKSTRYKEQNEGTGFGCPDPGRESKYLLSGIARCGECGGSLVVVGGQKRKYKTHYYYTCSYYSNRGETACTNNHREPMDRLNATVISQIRNAVLTSKSIQFVVDEAVKLLEKKVKLESVDTSDMRKEVAGIKKELDNFMGVIAQGLSSPMVVEQIKLRESRLEVLEQEISRLEQMKTASIPECAELEASAREVLGGFDNMLQSDIFNSRRALRALLTDAKGRFQPIRVTPKRRKGHENVTLSVDARLMVGQAFNKVGAEERTLS